MSYYDFDARKSRGAGFPPSVAEIDAGLRAHMQRVYGYMAGGLALTGLVAYLAAASGFYQSIAATPLIWLVMSSGSKDLTRPSTTRAAETTLEQITSAPRPDHLMAVNSIWVI